MDLSDIFHKKFEPERCFWVSDLHCQHINIVQGISKWDNGHRPFQSLEEMHDTIFDNINKIVPEDGILFDLGDGLFGDKSQATALRYRIRCKTIYRLFGNHDIYLRKDRKLQESLYTGCGDYLEIFVGKQLICNFHYPIEVWNELHRNAWNCCGHSHASLPDNLDKKRMDVGVDTEYGLVNGNLVMTNSSSTVKLDSIIHPRFHPFPFDEIQKIMSYKRNVSLDHHK